MTSDLVETTDASDPFEARVLCVDPSCIGVVGSDGRCGMCGLKGPELTDEQKAALSRESDAEALGAPDLAGSGAGANSDDPPAPAAADAASDEFEERRLCPDAGCIGLIGADGRCRECGASAS